MKKIVFVEDEHDVRRSIISLIDWEKYGFELVGEASNGQEGLSIVESQQPDVVLTDIRMPIMDGIEMSRYIHEFDPTIKIIFLSGHDKFEYAQLAIQLNVQAYLLKPISKADVEKALEEVAKSIDKERQQATDIMQMTKEYMRTLDVIRRSYLTSLMTEYFSVEEEERLQHLAELYQLNVKGNAYRIVSIALDGALKHHSIPSATKQTKDVIFAEELSWVSYMKMIQESSSKYVSSEVFRLNDRLILMLGKLPEDDEEKLDTLLLEIQQRFLKTYALHTQIGIGSQVSTLHDVRKSYLQSLEALNYCRSKDNLTQVYVSDIEQQVHHVEEISELVLENWLLAIKVGNEESFHQLSEQMYVRYFSKMYSAEDAHVILIELMAKVLQMYRYYVTIPDTKWVSQFMSTMMQAQSDLIENMYRHFVSGMHYLLIQIRDKRESTSGTLTAQALKIMRKNYNDPNLTQKSVANLLHVSPNYLSALFKKESNLSFKEHLIEIRMNQAYELLMNTDLKVLEIARLTGYTDQHYFSYSFKKQFGQSPRQMRLE